MALVEISNISFSFGKHQVLNQVNATFDQAKFTVILGRNGSGKSTLFHILSGLQKEYKGNVIFNGENRRAIKFGRKNACRIGFMTQFHQSTFPFSVQDVVLTGRAAFAKFAPGQKDFDLVEENLRAFKLWHLKDKPYTALSGGERQLVLLCRILVQQPDVLLLDEPTNHLDLHFQVAVMKHLKRLVASGTTVICIMHDPNLAFLYGEDFFVMQQGKLHQVYKENKEELIATLEKTYEIPLKGYDYEGGTFIIPQP